MRAEIARFFFDLRRVIGLAPPQIATQLKISIATLAALERADASALPPWSEVQRVVMSYTALAGIDGRPVLSALATLVQEVEYRRQMAVQVAAVRPAMAQSSQRLRQAGSAIAAGARRIPREAMNQARERPARTFYALSLPLGLLLLVLNSDIAQIVGRHVPRPLIHAATGIRDYLAVEFAPVREGLRWIEVNNPRTRRSDKLLPDR